MRVTLAETIESALPQRIAAVASVAGHFAVLGLALLAGVYPYKSVSSGAIAVDIVRADEMPPPQESPPPPQPALDLPQLTLTDQQAASQPTPESQPTVAPDPPPQPQQAAALEKPQPPQQPPPPAQPQTAPQVATSPSTPWPPPMAPPQLPDITERYQVMLGLPTDDIAPDGKTEMGGGEAAEAPRSPRATPKNCAPMCGPARRCRAAWRAPTR